MDTMLICLVYCLACLCLGALLVRLLAREWRGEPLAAFGTAFLLGQGALANIWLLIGLAGQFTPAAVVGISALCIAGGVRFAWPVLRDFARQITAALVALRQETPVWKFIAFLLAVILLALLLEAWFLPELAGDAAHFYMVVGKLMTTSGHARITPHFPALSQYGYQGEMHYGALMALGLDYRSKLFGWFTGIGTLVMLAALGRDLGLGRRGQWLVLVMALSSTAFVGTGGMSQGKVTLVSAQMGVAAFYWALQTGSECANLRAGALRLTALFTGLAIVAKVSYAVLAPGVLVVLLWQHVQARRGLPALVVDLFRAGVWGLLSLLPHFIKNAVFFGAPLLPFVGTGAAANTPIGMVSLTPYIGLAYPLVQVFGDFEDQANLSALWLAFMPLALLLPRPSTKSRLLQASTGALVGIAAALILKPGLLGHRPRDILVLLLILMLPVARGVECAAARRWVYRGVQGCVIVALLVIVGYPNLLLPVYPSFVRYLECKLSGCGEFYEQRLVTAYYPSTIINGLAEPGERAYLTLPATYWLRPDLLACAYNSNDVSRLYSTASADALWSTFYDLGFRYLLLDTVNTNANSFDLFYTHLDQLPGWMVGTEVYQDERYLLYRFESSDPDRATARCAQVNPPVWEVVYPE